MHLTHFSALTVALSASATASYAHDGAGEAQSTPADALKSLQAKALGNLRAASGNPSIGGCSLATANVRRDWADLTSSERKDYTNAVQCLLDSPSQSGPDLVPGAKNRFDDFAGQHINQTLTIHETGNFLSWHRYFMHTYETALRDECGYQGYLPYWNWFTYQDDPSASPVFDGSDTSIGSNGAYSEHNGSLAGGGAIFIPSGEGGGCVESGPFSNMTANLGPVRPAQDGLTASSCALCYNPRCLKRSLSNYTTTTWYTTPNLLNLTIGAAAASVLAFQNELQGRFADGFLGFHSSGHFTIGADADDMYSSPVDPAFYMHHTMVDQMFWLWQALNPAQAHTVAGSITFLNTPPSRNTMLNDTLSFNYLSQPPRPISDVLDTLGNTPLCYIYA